MIRYAVVALPLLGLFVFDPLPVDYHAVKTVALLAGALIVLAMALPARRFAFPLPVALAFLAFVAVRGLDLWRAPYSGRALRWWSLLLALLFVWLAATATTSRRFWRRAAPPIYGVALVVLSVWVGLQAFGAIDARQAHASFANRNFAGAGLAMLLPFAYRWHRWAGVVGLVGIAATGSRGGMVAAASAVALWFLWNRPKRWLALAAIPVVVVVLGLAFGERNTVKVRQHWYRTALTLGLERPAIGQGADGFAREYPPQRPLEEYQITGGRTAHAVHNDYLESFVDGGLLGLAAFLAFLGLAAYSARRWRPAACSLVAFGVAALVDLPLRDPSLLALAVAPLAATAARGPRYRGAPLVLAIGIGAVGVLAPAAWFHWRAECEWALVLGGTGNVDRVLELEPRHPDALLWRGSHRDLEILTGMQPHRAAALRRLARYLPANERADALRRILIDHDPHDVATRVALARLVLDDDRIQAVSLLDEAIRANPRAWRPHLLRAELARKARRFAEADRHLREAEWAEQRDRRRYRAVARERLELEIDSLRTGEVDQRLILFAVRRLEVEYVIARIEDALARARAAERSVPPLARPQREQDESIEAYTKRVQDAVDQRRRAMQKAAKLWYLEAGLLAEAVTQVRASSVTYRLRGQAARGLGELQRAKQMEALALFLETLDALRTSDRGLARLRWKRALAAHAGLPGEEAVKVTLGRFLRQYGSAYDLAKRLFGNHAELKAVFWK